MARVVGIGHEDFAVVRESNNFYVDKTNFIQEWWEANDRVTLITRPRRFGKTLNMSMLDNFFSVSHKNRSDLFEGLKIWKDEKYQKLQGTYPVVFLSFAGIKETSFTEARKSICRIIEGLYNKHDYLLKGNLLNEKEKSFYQEVTTNMSDSTASASLRSLTDFLNRYYRKKVIILLDEYDTPMQEAWVYEYWSELISFIRSLFNSTFKTNPYMERAIMTGITRVSKESVFSDLNNLEVITTTSDKYAECFGFTEEEVFAALDEFGLSKQKQMIKKWYDGFTFGRKEDIYNPWSVINFLGKKKAGAYWANTSANGLIEKLLRESRPNVKQKFEMLLNGEAIHIEIDEQIVYDQLATKKNAIWSLLLASGYLKVTSTTFANSTGRTYYDLMLTNKEVHIMFENMVQDWFSGNDDYNDFIRALLQNDLKAMNTYMNKVALEMFSYFDTGKNPSEAAPERFYHGFVLGLMVELSDNYTLTSNRESGFGRYDIMLEPKGLKNEAVINDAIIMEFKVQEAEEKELTDTVQEALRQIETQRYETSLISKGIPKEHIRKYGFAFHGKKVLIGSVSL